MAVLSRIRIVFTTRSPSFLAGFWHFFFGLFGFENGIVLINWMIEHILNARFQDSNDRKGPLVLRSRGSMNIAASLRSSLRIPWAPSNSNPAYLSAFMIDLFIWKTV